MSLYHSVFYSDDNPVTDEGRIDVISLNETGTLKQRQKADRHSIQELTPFMGLHLTLSSSLVD